MNRNYLPAIRGRRDILSLSLFLSAISFTSYTLYLNRKSIRPPKGQRGAYAFRFNEPFTASRLACTKRYHVRSMYAMYLLLRLLLFFLLSALVSPGGSVIKATSTVASAGYRSARGARSVIRKFRFRLRGVRRTRWRAWQKASRREAPPPASVARTGIVIKGLARGAKIFPSADFCPGTIHSALLPPPSLPLYRVLFFSFSSRNILRVAQGWLSPV